jgi:hypothetical protein
MRLSFIATTTTAVTNVVIELAFEQEVAYCFPFTMMS